MLMKFNSYKDALWFLMVGLVAFYVALDVRRALQKLRPSVPLQMNRRVELFMRINAWMVAAVSLPSAMWYLLNMWL